MQLHSGHRQRKRWLISLICSLALLVSPSFGKDKKGGVGVSADVAKPYAQVLPVVKEIAEDGLIRGTSEFRGTDQLDGATLVNKAKGLPAWKGAGTIFYKVRTDVLAPTNFEESEDKGTVIVRYIVEPVSPTSSRITIDALFAEDSHHRSHASEGAVETSEFVAISEKFRQMDEADRKAREKAEAELRHKKLVALQQEQTSEQAKLDSVNGEVNRLEQQIAELRKGRNFRVRTTTDLKSRPFRKAEVLRSLAVGDSVLVLLETPSWYRVQAGGGQQGWVYRLALEAEQ